MSKKTKKTGAEAAKEKGYPGYPKYPAKDDIYNREEKEPLDEEQKPDAAIVNEALDVPGAELDDENEKIGEEDEENNYYSLGGDNHEDLEEDKS